MPWNGKGGSSVADVEKEYSYILVEVLISAEVFLSSNFFARRHLTKEVPSVYLFCCEH
jgi:hypothetical protein